MIPTRTPFFLPWIYPQLRWRMNADTKDLYLTFDDGPVPGPTEFVLDTLAAFSCKATFFCIGDNIRKFPHVFGRIRETGHAIGNHTFNHLNGWKTKGSEYVQNIKMCDDEISRNGSAPHKNKLFRPPYGRITTRQVRALHDYRIVMWDVLTHDYHSALSPEKCLSTSLSATRNGSIIVFHDSYKAEKNIRFVLPRFIERLLEQGYHFKALFQ